MHPVHQRRPHPSSPAAVQYRHRHRSRLFALPLQSQVISPHLHHRLCQILRRLRIPLPPLPLPPPRHQRLRARSTTRCASPAPTACLSRLSTAIIHSRSLCARKHTLNPPQDRLKTARPRRGNQSAICLRTRRRSPGKTSPVLFKTLIILPSPL